MFTFKILKNVKFKNPVNVASTPINRDKGLKRKIITVEINIIRRDIMFYLDTVRFDYYKQRYVGKNRYTNINIIKKNSSECYWAQI